MLLMPCPASELDRHDAFQYSIITCCMQAQEMQQKGKAVLVDVREQKYFDKQHAQDCLHVGLFRPVEGRTRLDNLKRLAMAGFAMEATGAPGVAALQA